MKTILLIFLIFAVAFSDACDDLQACVQVQCPDQYAKCKSTSGCEDKVRKCCNQCGAKVNQTCYTFCIGVPGAAANVATCAANKGCVKSISPFDRAGLNLLRAIESYSQ